MAAWFHDDSRGHEHAWADRAGVCEAVYSLLAFLKRHKAKSSPRAIRFELLPGQAPALVLEPWEQRVVSYGTVYDGPPTEPIRIWGARRLLVLARVLPLAERFDVALLGTGLPSFWVACLPGMTLTLGLSGWTTNDWTRGSALDLLAPPATLSENLLQVVGSTLQQKRSMTLPALCTATGAQSPAVVAALRRLAFAGQVIHDLPNGVYRFRQVMPVPLGEAQLGEENPELAAARQLTLRSNAKLERVDSTEHGTLLSGRVEGSPVELIVDLDGRIRRGKCVCGHFRKYGIRNGPCRHMIVLRSLATTSRQTSSLAANGQAHLN